MKKIFYVPLVSVMLIACTKYENGPDYSLLTKKERLSNNWTVSEAIHQSGDNTDFHAVYVNYQFNIGADENYTMTYKPNGGDDYCELGTWAFNNDKTHFVTTSSSGKMVDYTILRLTKNELWVRFSDETSEWDLHLWPKSQ